MKLEKMYKKAARHWFWQILKWKLTGNFIIKACIFCNTNQDKTCSFLRTAHKCLIDKTLCTCYGDGDLLGKITQAKDNNCIDDMFKLAKELKNELKKRSK